MATVVIRPDSQRWFSLLPQEQQEQLAGAQITKIEVQEQPARVVLFVSLPARPADSVRQGLAALFAEQLGGAQVEVRFDFPPPQPTELADCLAAAWPQILQRARVELPRLNGFLDHLAYEVVAGQLQVTLPQAALELLSGAEERLASLISQETGWQGRLQISGIAEAEPPVETDFAQAYFENEFRATQAAPPKRESPLPDGPLLRGRAIAEGQAFRPIKSLVEPEPRVAIFGKVFSLDTRETRSGKIMVQLGVTDLEDSISVKFFRDKQEAASEERLRPGTWVKLRGDLQEDRFSGELTIMCSDLSLAEPPPGTIRVDDAPQKRVELHLHTTYSSMDGLVDPKAAVKQAAKWGHRAMAITDHGVVQAFPFAAQALPADFKLLYGCELYVVDDGYPIVQRPPAGLPLAEAEFVVLDIETTGFSPIGDDIIELGAVRYQGGRVIESFQSFVRPSKPIPPEVQELTNINEAMVADAPEPAAALRDFFAFCGDAILVAHNAAFDYPFLRHHRQKHLGEELQNPVLDTLTLARALLPDLRRFNLQALCRELAIPLNNHHRADADARTAAVLLEKLLEKVEGCEQVSALNGLLADLRPEVLPPYHVTVLVQRQAGMKNLYKLISASHLQYFNRTPKVPLSLLREMREGLLIGSADEQGLLFEALMQGRPQAELEEIAGFFDYLEIQPTANYQRLIREGQLHSQVHLQGLNRQIVALGEKLGIPVVATGDVHFLEPHEQQYRSIMRSGIGFRDEHDAPLYLRTTPEMLAEFAYLGEEKAFEVVVTNTNKIADLIEVVEPVPKQLFAPKVEGAEEATRQLTYEKAKAYYGDPLPELVEARLKRELDAIIGNNFAVIYYIAHLLVDKSNEMGYLVGSRGSVGSSLVAWCMGITEVNALPPHYLCRSCHQVEWFNDGSVGSGYDLPDKDCPHCDGGPLYKDGQDIPFETFLGFKGDKVPDIDLNFSGEVQGRIQKFTEEQLGGERYVFKAGTIGTIAEKTAFGMVRAWMEEKGVTHLSDAHVDYLSRGFVGVKRTTGQHPGGMVVVPVGMEVEEVTPVQYPADDRSSGVKTTHFDYHSYEHCLLKLDILGHDDPTSLRMLSDLTGVDVTTIPMNDPQVMALFSPGGSAALGLQPGDVELDLGTIAVPEFGTGFVRRMLVETQPKNFSDLVRISGLSHGTDVWTNNAQELIKRGTCTLQTVIPTRDDIMVFLMYKGLEPAVAFQIMERVRRGRGLSDEMEATMREHGVPDWYIWSCKQIKYMFPKAHAAAYVLSSVRVAWFKVHYPKEYYATYFTVRSGAFDADIVCAGQAKVEQYMQEIIAKGREATAKEREALTEMELVREALLRGIRFARVDLYKSHATEFLIQPDGSLLCPFTALPGLGEAAAQGIVNARADGPFQSIEDLRTRSRANRAVIELLQNHGTLTGMPETNQLVFGF